MTELTYLRTIRTFRHRIQDNLMQNGSIKSYYSFYIHDYYPKNHFSEVDGNISAIRKMVYDLKDGRNSIIIANLFAEAIRSQSLNLQNTCLVVIPASNQEKTVIRYNTFCNALSTQLGISNTFEAITTEPHESTKGTSGGDKIKYFNFNNAPYRNKNVLLIDDVRTSGTTYIQVLTKLMSTGASNVTGIFLAKTVSHH
jgi:ATP-dependent DNA helicase RecQ